MHPVTRLKHINAAKLHEVASEAKPEYHVAITQAACEFSAKLGHELPPVIIDKMKYLVCGNLLREQRKTMHRQLGDWHRAQID